MLWEKFMFKAWVLGSGRLETHRTLNNVQIIVNFTIKWLRFNLKNDKLNDLEEYAINLKVLNSIYHTIYLVYNVFRVYYGYGIE